MDLYVFTFHKDKQLYRALSPLTPEQVAELGLPTEAVLGQIDAVLPSMTPDQFEQNEAFLALVHQTIQEAAPQFPLWQTEARTRGMGQLHIIDGRAGQVTGDIGQEDILGFFELRRGEIIHDSYQPNPHYKLLTDNGPIQLPTELEHALLHKIEQTIHQATGENNES